MEKLFLSVGAMKSGTTWLYRQLEQHPCIHFSPEKELHYLAWRAGERHHLRLAYRLSRARAARAREKSQGRRQSASDLWWYLDYLLAPRTWRWYERRFGAVSPGIYPADFSNLSALLEESQWRELANRVADLRVTYVLRDPLDRIWSHLKAQYASGLDPQRLAGMTRYTADPRLSEHDLLRHSRYADNLQRLFRVLPRERVHVVFYDQIAAEPTRLLKGIEQFLDIPEHCYMQDKLGRRINASDTFVRPDWVREHFLPQLEQDLARLAGLGIEVPETWCK